MAAEGWSARDVMPIFDAIEDDVDTGTAPGIRRGGPLPVYRAPQEQWGAVDLGLRDAALALGYPWKADLNAPTGEGVSCNPINSRNGHRVTTNDAYLEAARHRPNLDIRGEALVDRVLFDGTRATGLRVRLGGTWQVLQGREIILCAGAVHSPAILLRSGIGPGAELAALGIPVLQDQPAVGRNLMDHPILRASLALRPQHRAQHPDARHTNCCVTYSSHLAGGGDRDMILIAYNHRGLNPGKRVPAGNGGVGVALYEAFSRGVLRLTSSDPDAQPSIEEHMLSDPRDLLRMRDGVRRLAQLTDHAALADLAEQITFGDTALSLPQAVALPDAELDALMLQEAGDIQHAAGTCAMSAYEDPRGAVDPRPARAWHARAARGRRLHHAGGLPGQPSLHLRNDRGGPGTPHAGLIRSGRLPGRGWWRRLACLRHLVLVDRRSRLVVGAQHRCTGIEGFGFLVDLRLGDLLLQLRALGSNRTKDGLVLCCHCELPLRPTHGPAWPKHKATVDHGLVVPRWQGAGGGTVPQRGRSEGR